MNKYLFASVFMRSLHRKAIKYQSLFNDGNNWKRFTLNMLAFCSNLNAFVKICIWAFANTDCGVEKRKLSMR